MNNQKRSKTKTRGTGTQELGVILEDVASKMDLVLEGHAVLDRKIDVLREDMDAGFERVDARFEQVDARFDAMDQRFEQVDARFDAIDQRFEQVDARFEQVDGQLDRVFDELHVIRNDLKEKVGREEFILLEKRVSALEKSKK